MGEGFLIDTSAVIKYLTEVFSDKAVAVMDKALKSEYKISFVTQIELLVFKTTVYSDIQIREQFVEATDIVYVNKGVIDKAIYIRRETNIQLPDAIIAASAMHYEHTLISTNDRDFVKVIPLGLKYLNPEKNIEE
ncbi:MAG: type II toxin-antitoxin system VapC family toxin [Bacteroidales bacterium]|nr:type II toxin-antitoxin system VapC family toxin [Bacteroidales bacterium]